MEQAQDAEAPLVGLFHPLRFTLDEVAPLDGLDDDRLALLVSGLDVFEIQGPLHVIPCELGVQRLHRVLKSVVCVSRPAEVRAVYGERRADRRQPRAFHLAGKVEVRPRHFGRREGHVDVVVRVDPDGGCDEVGHARLDVVGRPGPRRANDHRRTHPGDGGKEVPPRTG